MAEAIVAGHLCLDIIPLFKAGQDKRMAAYLSPGQLTEVGPATLDTGGAVSNTGINLHRLGISTLMMGKISDDLWGQAILDIVNSHGPELAQGMILVPGEVTSYTVVIDPPAVDRAFLHYSGANETFGVDDVRYDLLDQARLFHFGYPPLMNQLLAGEGAGLTEMFRRAKEQGVTTSLDLTMPDKTGPSSRVDWRSVSSKALRYVDLFVPSVPELLYMLHREQFDTLMARPGSIPVHEALATEEIDSLAKEALTMGPSIVLLKAGTRGMLLRTAPLRANLGRGAPADRDRWSNRQMWVTCFRPDTVASSVGTGDAAIAGFLAAMLRGGDPALALNVASATGASCVEVSGALGGVQSWESTLARIRAGWARLPLNLDQPGWVWDEEHAVWLGPLDQTADPTRFALG